MMLDRTRGKGKGPGEMAAITSAGDAQMDSDAEQRGFKLFS